MLTFDDYGNVIVFSEKKKEKKPGFWKRNWKKIAAGAGMTALTAAAALSGIHAHKNHQLADKSAADLAEKSARLEQLRDKQHLGKSILRLGKKAGEGAKEVAKGYGRVVGGFWKGVGKGIGKGAEVVGKGIKKAGEGIGHGIKGIQEANQRKINARNLAKEYEMTGINPDWDPTQGGSPRKR